MFVRNVNQRRQNQAVPEEIQIVSNAAADPTAVIVPIALWNEITSARETAYLLKSEAMRQRLRAAMQREDGVALDDALSKLGL